MNRVAPSVLHGLVDRALYLIDPMAISHMTLGTEWRVDAEKWIKDVVPILFPKRVESAVPKEGAKEGAMKEPDENSSVAEWRAWAHDHVDMYERTLVVPAKVLLGLVAERDSAREQAAAIRRAWDDERERL